MAETPTTKKWPPLKQPFTDNLMDAVLRNMSDAELDAVIARDAERMASATGPTQTTDPDDIVFTVAESDEILRLHIVDGLTIDDAMRRVFDQRQEPINGSPHA